jgi:hypothetical protein
MMLDQIFFLLSWALVPIGLLRYQVKGLRPFLGVNALVGALVCAIYLYEGGIAGAAMSMAATSALALQFAIGHKIGLYARVAMALPFIAVGLYAKEPGLAAWLPFCAFAIARAAETLQRDLALRVILLFCTSLWIIYGTVLNLPQIVIFEALGLASNALGIWRFHIRKTQEA